MKFSIITIFPKIFDSYFSESIISRAKKNNLVEINIHNLRDYTTDKHKTVDDTPYGGGAGMVMKVEPIYKAVEDVKNVVNVEDVEHVQQAKRLSNFNKQSDLASSTFTTSTTVRTILFSAKGKKYTEADARRLSKYDNLILICGRYEGVDERVAKHIADEEISIGNFVLTGGEIPAMILVDSITRLIPGVLGNADSLKEESFGATNNQQPTTDNFSLEYPQYTKPESFNKWKVPKILLSGNHGKIGEWREKQSKKFT